MQWVLLLAERLLNGIICYPFPGGEQECGEPDFYYCTTHGCFTWCFAHAC